MKGIKKARREDRNDSLTWDKPFAEDKVIRHAERAFTEASSKIAFTTETVLSIDDDQYRLRSALVDHMGLARLNNPKKAFGPVSTNCVSIGTGLVLGMNLLGRSQNFDDVVKLLLMWITQSNRERDILAHNMICLDRGYLTKNLINFLLLCGFELTGILPTLYRINTSYYYSFLLD
jgi:hypothetical protein